MFRQLPIRAGGGAGSAARPYPFDITVTETDDVYKARVYPGTVSQLLPTNMYDEFTIDNTSFWKLIIYVSTNGQKITSCTMDFVTENPAVQTPTPFSLPTSVELCAGLVNEGTVYRTIGFGSIILNGELAFTVERTPIALPGQLTYIPYYSWLMSVA